MKLLQALGLALRKTKQELVTLGSIVHAANSKQTSKQDERPRKGNKLLTFLKPKFRVHQDMSSTQITVSVPCRSMYTPADHNIKQIEQGQGSPIPKAISLVTDANDSSTDMEHGLSSSNPQVMDTSSNVEGSITGLKESNVVPEVPSVAVKEEKTACGHPGMAVEKRIIVEKKAKSIAARSSIIGSRSNTTQSDSQQQDSPISSAYVNSTPVSPEVSRHVTMHDDVLPSYPSDQGTWNVRTLMILTLEAY